MKLGRHLQTQIYVKEFSNFNSALLHTSLLWVCRRGETDGPVLYTPYKMYPNSILFYNTGGLQTYSTRLTTLNTTSHQRVTWYQGITHHW